MTGKPKKITNFAKDDRKLFGMADFLPIYNK